ncbi:MAG TPA: hypothetical protein VFL13_05335 [Candidatus Baltobacteraceae bacterium]|nr:hypothetical protein [Candidatus Baltobacteraceae bacterium]
MTLDELAENLYDNDCRLLETRAAGVALFFTASWTGEDGSIAARVVDAATRVCALGIPFEEYPFGFGIDYIRSEGSWCEIQHNDDFVTFTLDETRPSRVKTLALNPGLSSEQQIEIGRAALQDADGWEPLTSL